MRGTITALGKLGWILAAVAVLAAAHQALHGAERKYATIVAVGASAPVQSEEGRTSPVLFVEHESAGHYGEGTFRFLLETAVLNLGMTHPFYPEFHLEYRGRLVYLVEGDPFSIYRDGRRLRPQTFAGNSAGAILAGHLAPEGRWGGVVEGEHREHHFFEDEDTAAGFQLPSDFAMDEVRTGVVRRGLFGEEDARLRLTVTFGRRRRWDDWGLDPQAQDKARYTKQELRLEQPLHWSEFSATKLDLRAAGGSHLDLFSGYWVGGIFGQHPVGGYFRQEFRAQRVALLNARHDLNFSDDRVLTFYGDAAWLEELELEHLRGSPPSRTLGSIGFGFLYGIRPLKGLPVIFRYAEGLNVPSRSLESHRREVQLLIAVGF